MPQPYNLTNITSSTNLYGVVKTANELVGGTFGIAILLMTWFVTFIALKRYPTQNAVFPASFVTFLVAMGLFLGGIIPQYVLMMSIVILALSLVWIKMSS